MSCIRSWSTTRGRGERDGDRRPAPVRPARRVAGVARRRRGGAAACRARPSPGACARRYAPAGTRSLARSQPSARALRRSRSAYCASMKVIVHVDGGARGNPGPAAAACVIASPAGEILDEHTQLLGTATNNVAEYRALLLGLERARALGASEVEVVGDSELIAKQVQGLYKVKHQAMRPAAPRGDGGSRAGSSDWSIRTVPRAQNARADALVNAALDQRARRRRARDRRASRGAGAALEPVLSAAAGPSRRSRASGRSRVPRAACSSASRGRGPSASRPRGCASRRR